MKIIKMLFIILTISLFFGCFSPFTNDNTYISIRLGPDTSMAMSGRWAHEHNEHSFDLIEHIITLTGPGNTVSEPVRVRGEGTVTLPISRAGRWNVSIEAEIEGLLYATGNKSIDVKLGLDNPVPIEMIETDTKFFIVWTGDEWEDARDGVRDLNLLGHNKFAIIIANDIFLNGLPFPLTDPSIDNTFRLAININVDIRGNHTITLNSTGSLLRVRADQTVTVRDTKFNGNGGIVENTTTLINVAGQNSHLIFRGSAEVHSNKSAGAGAANGGGGVSVTGSGAVFEMHDNSSIHNNEINLNGGGVSIDNNGTFIMHNGSIYNNEAVTNVPSTTGNGGGVSLGGAAGATFTMNNGRIYGNTAENNGGGVFVGTGAFEMTGGIVYGNDAGTDLSNSAADGAALYKNSSATAQYLNGITNTYEDILTWQGGSVILTELTFRVVDGVLLGL